MPRCATPCMAGSLPAFCNSFLLDSDRPAESDGKNTWGGASWSCSSVELSGFANASHFVAANVLLLPDPSWNGSPLMACGSHICPTLCASHISQGKPWHWIHKSDYLKQMLASDNDCIVLLMQNRMHRALDPQLGAPCAMARPGQDKQAWSIEQTRRLARCRMYGEAERGLQPISWSCLGLGRGQAVYQLLCAGPLETLAQEDFDGIMRFDRAMDHCFIHRRFRELRELQYAHRAAMAARREQARQYGMLVCRAFFQTTTVSQGMPDLLLSRAYAPVIVELVEEFLNG